MEMVSLFCSKCGKSFDRPAKEHRRSVSLGRLPYCSISCHAIVRNGVHSKGNLNNLKPKNKEDEYSPFRFILNQVKAKAKQRKKEFDLTLNDLIEQWERQAGKCPYTGYKLLFPSQNTAYKKRASNPYFASLDRIDSNLGYKKDNIEFVCMVVNFAKNKFEKKDIKEFFTELRYL
jgi:DNA-directed RNA polymerase subunit RPC12/RpoP